MSMDLRESLNAISDVIVNRPPPLREFDQIYMKAADMLIQADHVSKWVDGRDVVFIGDGDAVSLCLVHLHQKGHLERGPKSVRILDFDERVVNSMRRFAERHGYGDRIGATLYNVADPLPEEYADKFDAFYTNPPFGGSNGGASILAFFRRGIDACRSDATCCAVLADDVELPWCNDVLRISQGMLIDEGFAVAEMIPAFHGYHLDDKPDLTSCSLIGRRMKATKTRSASEPLSDKLRANFYGRGAQLKIRYVRDLRNGGKMASHDHVNEPFPELPKENS